MPTYLHPGVYIEEIPSGVRPIEAIGTSTAAFLGYTRKGELGKPVRITKWDEYESFYGGISAGSDLMGPDIMGHSVAAFFSNGGSSAYIVRLAQGANPAEGLVLHPDANPDNIRAEDRLIRFVAANGGVWGRALRVTLSPKALPDSDLYSLLVEIDRAPGPGLPTAPEELERYDNVSLDPADAGFVESQVNDLSEVIRADVDRAADHMVGTSTSEPLNADADYRAANGRRMTVSVDGNDRLVNFTANEFKAGSTLADVAAAIQTRVRDVGPAGPEAVREFACAVSDDNRLVLSSGAAGPNSSVTVTGPAQEADDATQILRLGEGGGGVERTGPQVLHDRLSPGAPVRLSGGSDGGPPTLEQYEDVLSAFLKVRDVNIISLPGQSWKTESEIKIIQAAIAHAETARSRMVLVDPPRDAELTTEAEVAALGLNTSTYAALYYPWLLVANPLYHPETNPGEDRTVPVPPSGFVAGMWARTDARRGVWKAPAGTESGLLGAAGLRHIVEDGEQDVLNPLGVNCLRRFPDYGQVIWGARTLATRANPEWRYVPVRRTAMFIEGSIYIGIQWAVFEPNDHNLWASLRANIDSFMNGLFRTGAFQGAKASDAYFVRCGLGDTMTQGDIDRGQVIVIVGFAPLKPAEFVIVRIQQQVGQQ